MTQTTYLPIPPHTIALLVECTPGLTIDVVALIEQMGVRPPNVHSNVKKLVELGALEAWTRQKAQIRTKVVKLTPKGEEIRETWKKLVSLLEEPA